MIRKLACCLTAFALLSQVAICQPAAPADAMLGYVPADAELVMSLNVRQTLDSPVVQRVIEKRGGRSQLDAKLGVLGNVIGANPMKDIEHAYLWGRIDDPDSFALVVKGQFNQEALLNLVKANKDYATTEIQGLTVHTWCDRRQHKTKYGVFLPEGAVAIFSDLAGINAAIDAKNTGKGFVSTPKAAVLPLDKPEVELWSVMLKPERQVRCARFKDMLQAQSAVATLDLQESAVDAKMKVNAASPEAAKEWLDLAEGFVALGKLQQTNAALQHLATLAKASVDEASNSMTVQLHVSYEDLKGLRQQLHKH